MTTENFAISEDGSTFLLDSASKRAYLRPGSFRSGFTTAVDLLPRSGLDHSRIASTNALAQHIKSPRYECCNIVDLSLFERLPTQTVHSFSTSRRTCSRIKPNNGTPCGLGARYPPLQVFPSLALPNILSNHPTSLDIQTVKPLRTSLDSLDSCPVY